jgi:acyl carrier protein
MKPGTQVDSAWYEEISGLSPGQREKLSRRLIEQGLLDSCGDSQLRLVAYYIKDTESPELDGKELRAHLKERVTSAMIPTHFVPMASLPETATGKLDRGALPAPDWSSTGISEQPKPPSTEYESTIIAIWEEVLGVEPISIEDDFFSVGGDSLLATRVITRIRKALAVAITPRDIFETPILKDLAAVVSRQSSSSGSYEEFEL